MGGRLYYSSRCMAGMNPFFLLFLIFGKREFSVPFGTKQRRLDKTQKSNDNRRMQEAHTLHRAQATICFDVDRRRKQVSVLYTKG